MQRVIAYFAALVISVVALAVGIRVTADHTTALEEFKGGPDPEARRLPGGRLGRRRHRRPGHAA